MDPKDLPSSISKQFKEQLDAAKDFDGMPGLEQTDAATRQAETKKMFASSIKNQGLVSLDDSSDEEKEDLKSNNSKSAPVPISEYTELEELD